MGGGGDGRSTKKHSRKGKLNEKNSCTPINPKKYCYYGLKKIHSRNLITKKNFALENSPPPPPITFLMVRPLHHLKTATVFFVCFDVVVVTVVFDITQNYRMSKINITCFAANQRRPACEIRYTYSSFLLLNSCGMGGLFGLCQKSAKRRNIL